MKIPWLYYGGFFDPTKLASELQDLEEQTASNDVWDDPKRAGELLQRKSQLEGALNKFRNAETELSDLKVLIQLAEEENDSDTLLEAEKSLVKFHDFVNLYKIESFFSGDADKNDCYLEVHAGAGGTEAQDWAQMLLRMYSRWAENHRYKLELLEESIGEEAGIKSTTIKILGLNAYGWLKHESGIHRLVRISPFDSNARRHTSFASVWVYPVVDEKIQVDIQDSDLRIDTYRASGAGGQHVNKTDSAVRITHIPTGIVVQSQTDRSQHRNKSIAFEMLRSRLYELELRKRDEQNQQKDKADIGWGNQIRSYVLQPYQMVKDLRTGCEQGNAGAVLNGEIDQFLQAAISGLD